MDPTQQNRMTNVFVSQQGGVRPGVQTAPVTPQGLPSAGVRPVKPEINWGGIAKGAVIVLGVVVVGVVVAGIISGLMTTALAGATGGALATSAVHGATTTWGIMQSLGHFAFSGVSSIFTGLAHGLGIVAPAVDPVARLALTNTAATIGGVGAAALATPLALKHISTIPLMEPSNHHMLFDPSAHGMNSTDSVTAAATLAGKKSAALNQALDPADVADHSAHHLSEDQDHRATRNVLARSAQANKSWTDKVAAAQAAKTTVIKRDSSFANQLDADTAKLNGLLDSGRA